MEIEMKDVSKVIKKVKVLDSVTALIPSGSVVGLVGPNGSGKTMLMRAMSGLIRLSSGSITFDGVPLGKGMPFPPSTGIMIENPQFLESRTGAENLELLLRVRHAGDKSMRGRHTSKAEMSALIKEALEYVGLDPADGRKLRAYSLGMKQRLGIAAAVMGWPRLVIMDEPTNALDAEGVALFEGVMARLRREASTVVLASHDASVIGLYCDEVLRLYEGRLVSHECNASRH